MTKMLCRKPKDDENGFDEWGGYMGAKVQKLEQQYAYDAANNPYKQSDLFAGIAIFVNGLTNPSASELKRIMMMHGGVMHAYYRTGVTTFIIAENLPDVKIRQLSASRTIIRAEWVVECVRQMRIVDYSHYLLYTASTRTDQPKLCFGPRSNGATADVRELNTSTVLTTGTDGRITAERLDIDENVDEDIFAEKTKCHDGEHIPPVDDLISKKPTISIEKDESPLNTSITSNLNFLNVKLRKLPSDTNLAPLKLVEKTTAQPVDERKNMNHSAVIESNKSIQSTSTHKSVLTAVDPNFLAEYYNNSRLHHIATLGASFKTYISMLRETRELNHFPARQELANRPIALESSSSSSSSSSIIMHIDMDCFFVSVGLRSRPHLRGRPVAVTHSKNGSNIARRPGADPHREREMWAQRHARNTDVENRMDTKTSELPLLASDSLAEIASCSYEARACGLRNGMFVGAALKLCPDLCTIPYDFDGYKEVSQQLYDTVARYTLDIEAVSCDEMYVELQDVLRTTGLAAEEFVKYVRNEIVTLTGCPCSAGIGSNRLQARMATKKAKPNGQYHLRADDVDDYFASIELKELPGIGYSMQQKLSRLGWATCGNLQAISVGRLQTELGKKLGETVHQLCRGIDSKPLVYGQVRKSVSAEVNYGIRFAVDAEFERFLQQLCAEVHSRLVESRCRGKSITLKLMVRADGAPVETAKFLGHGVCDTLNKTTSLADTTDDADAIRQTVFAIKHTFNVRPEEIRGVGIQIGKLVPAAASMAGQSNNRLKTMFANVKPKLVANKVDACSETVKKSPSPSKRRLRSKRALSLDVSNVKKRAYKKRSAKEPTTASMVNNSLAELDLAVLAELPDDIREEAVHAFRLTRHSSERPKVETKKRDSANPKTKLDMDFLLALPEDIRKEVIDDMKNREISKQNCTDPDLSLESKNTLSAVQEDNANILLKANWKDLIIQWIQNTVDGGSPVQQDIEIIADYAVDLIRERRLDDLCLRMRYLFRIIDENHACEWHNAYKQIVDFVQNEMLRIYQADLKLPNGFSCDKCD